MQTCATAIAVAFAGLEARRVEVQQTGGTHDIVIVGLGDKAVSEARERVRAAFASVGLAIPAGRLVVTLAPADLPKEGKHHDLPIALAMMAAIGSLPHDALDGGACNGRGFHLPRRVWPGSGVGRRRSDRRAFAALFGESFSRRHDLEDGGARRCCCWRWRAGSPRRARPRAGQARLGNSRGRRAQHSIRWPAGGREIHAGATLAGIVAAAFVRRIA
jgi:hypothetical protein